MHTTRSTVIGGPLRRSLSAPKPCNLLYDSFTTFSFFVWYYGPSHWNRIHQAFSHKPSWSKVSLVGPCFRDIGWVFAPKKIGNVGCPWPHSALGIAFNRCGLYFIILAHNRYIGHQDSHRNKYALSFLSMVVLQVCHGCLFCKYWTMEARRILQQGVLNQVTGPLT
jgi:hypothetical protein